MNTKKNKNIRMSKYSNKELLEMEPLEVYKHLLNGDITRFPTGFWDNEDSEENSIICTRYLLEEILKWDLEFIKKNIRMKVFIKYKLGGMMQKLYENSPYQILKKLYANQFMPWELHEAPANIWKDKANMFEAMDWLINTKLKWSKEDIKEKFSGQILKDNDLGGLLSEAYHGSPLALLNDYMPNAFKSWELKASQPGAGYWMDKENRINAIKYLIEDVYNWDKEAVKSNICQEIFTKNGLDGLITKYYGGSPYRALEEVYPGEFLPWELSCAPVGYWESKENRVKVLKWLFEDKLKWSVEDIKKNISQSVFTENGLTSLMMKRKNGLYGCISEAYPEIKEWELPFTRSSYWESEENRKNALDYLFNEKLQWSIDDIKKNLSQKLFINNNLSGLLNYYNGSPYMLITDYLPNENIKAWELKVVPNSFWSDDKNCVDAIKWFINKCDINSSNIDSLTQKLVMKHKIYEVVKRKYNNSMINFKKDLINYV